MTKKRSTNSQKIRYIQTMLCFTTGNTLENKSIGSTRRHEILAVLVCLLSSALALFDVHIGAFTRVNALYCLAFIWGSLGRLVDRRFSDPRHLRLLGMSIGSLPQEFLHQRPPTMSAVGRVLDVGSIIILLSAIVAQIAVRSGLMTFP